MIEPAGLPIAAARRYRMAQAPSSTVGPRRPPRALFTLLNPTFALLLRTPLHGLLSGRLMLLTFTGRKTGRRYTTPVGYTQTDERTLLTPTESRWKRNLAGGAPVRVRLRGRTLSGTASVIDDEEGLRQSYRTMLAMNPQLRRILTIATDANGDPDPEEVRRYREAGHVVVRIRLDEAVPMDGAAR
jgi:deazaflavin-dependent oxidoreductase (nitroreductase family)